MQPQLSFITLGVDDLTRSLGFYRDTLGLKPHQVLTDVVFFKFGALRLALYTRQLLAQDAGVAEAGTGFRGVALALNVQTVTEVDQLLSLAIQGGGALTKPGQATSWGGYAGYFADPDGHVWEVAWNPRLDMN